MDPLLSSLPSTIETERLSLRPYRLEDRDCYYEMSQRNKAHLAQFESGNPVMGIHTLQDADTVVRDFIESWQTGKYFFLGAFEKDNGEFAAQVYIGVVNPDLPEYEIGYFSDVDHEGQGYVTEAVFAALRFVFNHLGAHRVRLECDDTNLRSYRVAERCGFYQEGHIRENKRHADGSFTGTLHYGLLRAEFPELK